MSKGQRVEEKLKRLLAIMTKQEVREQALMEVVRRDNKVYILRKRGSYERHIHA